MYLCSPQGSTRRRPPSCRHTAKQVRSRRPLLRAPPPSSSPADVLQRTRVADGMQHATLHTTYNILKQSSHSQWHHVYILRHTYILQTATQTPRTTSSGRSQGRRHPARTRAGVAVTATTGRACSTACWIGQVKMTRNRPRSAIMRIASSAVWMPFASLAAKEKQLARLAHRVNSDTVPPRSDAQAEATGTAPALRLRASWLPLQMGRSEHRECEIHRVPSGCASSVLAASMPSSSLPTRSRLTLSRIASCSRQQNLNRCSDRPAVLTYAQVLISTHWYPSVRAGLRYLARAGVRVRERLRRSVARGPVYSRRPRRSTPHCCHSVLGASRRYQPDPISAPRRGAARRVLSR